MNANEIANLLRAQPFLPFRIVLSNQRSYEIRIPDMVMVTPRTTHIGTRRNLPDNHPLYDAVDVVSNVHIAQLEPIVPAGV